MNDANPQRWGWWLLVVGFGGGLLWALTAPLDSGVSAVGTVVVTGYRKAVQPMIPGKIVSIQVKDGDEVAEGQVLVRLDDTQSRSQLDIATGQWLTTLAAKARQESERTGRVVPVFPTELTEAKQDPRAMSAMTLQTQLMATRRGALVNELAGMAENLHGIELQIIGIEASRLAKEEQLHLMHEQLNNQRSLADDGFLPRNRVLEQEREISRMVGAIAEDTGSIGRSRQSVAEIKSRVAARQQEVRKELEAQLSDTQREESSLRSRLNALRFDLANTEIRSPVSGLVMGLVVHTEGGVVAAGAAMMEVVPKNEILKVEVQIPPHLIDKVKLGLLVDIMFTALHQSSTPTIDGKVIAVSADVLMDPKQNQPYYKALVEVTQAGMVKLKKNDIRAGMPAEVFLHTGERTAMNYFLKPLLDRLQSALTEP